MANTNFSGPIRSAGGFQAYAEGTTNLSIPITPIGTGVVLSTSGPVYGQGAAVTIATATAVTLTAAQLKAPIILQDPSGGGVTTTTPTAALIVASIPSAVVGTAVRFVIRNTADAAETITVAAGTGVTLSGTMTIAQNNSKEFQMVLTNVTSGAEAVTIYSLGTVVF